MSWEAHAPRRTGSALSSSSFFFPSLSLHPFLFSPFLLFLIAFFLPASLPSTVAANAARDDNERRNPAGISARDKRTLTAYEQASALMVPTPHRRLTGSLSLFLTRPFSPFFRSFPRSTFCCRFLFLLNISFSLPSNNQFFYLPTNNNFFLDL